MTRTETIKFNDFMGGEYSRKVKEKQTRKRGIMKATATTGMFVVAAKTAIPLMAVTIPIALITRGIPAMANTGVPGEVIMVNGISDAVKERIVHAFDPLVDLMVALSLPIAGVMITGGALMSMVGFKEKGYSLIFSASLGYILVQLSPMLIDLLFGVGSAI
jgi:hypothetical protein